MFNQIQNFRSLFMDILQEAYNQLLNCNISFVIFPYKIPFLKIYHILG